MKKMYKISAIYLIFALTAGVFYRESSKFMNYIGETALAKVHPHALMLGTALFAVLPVFMKLFEIQKDKSFNKFIIFYNIGLVATLVMMAARGVTQIFNLSISSGVSHIISGFAGMGHIILTVGIFFLYRAFIKSTKEN